MPAVQDFFSLGYIPAPDTIFEGIAKLPPAHWMSIEPGRDGGAPSIQQIRYAHGPAPSQSWRAGAARPRAGARKRAHVTTSPIIQDEILRSFRRLTLHWKHNAAFAQN